MSRVFAIFRRWPVPILILLITLLFFVPVFTQGRTIFSANFLVSFYNPWLQDKFTGWEHGVPNKPVGADDIRIFYPQRVFTQSAFKSLQLPFWNPYSFSGNYHIGLSETAVFYPLFFLFLAIPQSLAWTILQIAEPLIAFVGMYFFLKYFLERQFAFFGAVVFAFSGVVLVRMVEGLSVGHTLIWMPYVLWGIEGFLKKRKINFIALTTLALAFPILAGWFQFAFYIFVYSFVYCSFRIFWDRKNLKENFWMFLPFVIAPLLTLFHILPAFTTLLNSPREGISILDLSKHLLPMSHLFALFYPDYWGNPATLSFFGRSEYKESIVAIGVIPVLLSIFSLGQFRKYKVLIFFASTAVMAFLLGTENAFSKSFMNLQIPIVSSFLPDRTMYLVTVSLSVLSAFGIKEFVTSKDRKNYMIFVLVIIISGLVILFSHRQIVPFFPIPAIFKVVLKSILEPVNAYFDGRPGPFIDPVKATLQAKNVILGDFFIILFCLTYLFREHLSKKITISFLFVLTILGQLYFGYKYIPFSYPQFLYPDTPVFSFLESNAGFDRFISTGSGYIPSNMPLPFKIFSPDGVGSMYPKEYGELVQFVLSRGGSSEASRIEARIESSADDLLGGENFFLKRFMQIDGIRYVIVLRDEVPKKVDNNYKMIWENDKWRVYQFLDVYPRTFWTNKFEVPPKDHYLDRLFDKNLPQQTILLEKQISGLGTGVGKGEVKIVEYSPNRIVINSVAEESGLVYLSDNYTDKFEVYVDGDRTELLKANYSFRAIKVSAGTHKVEFRYVDEDFNKGIAIALVVVVICGVGYFLVKRKKLLS